MKLLVCGGRDYDDAVLVDEVLAWLAPNCIIEGGALGADTLARRWASATSVPCQTIPADWEAHGKAAGPIRNVIMLEMKPDIVLAFPGGRGTDNCVKQALARGIPVLRVEGRHA